MSGGDALTLPIMRFLSKRETSSAVKFYKLFLKKVTLQTDLEMIVSSKLFHT